MQPLFTAEEMRRLDQRAIAELGIPGATLMETAGRAAAARIVDVVRAHGVGRREIVVVCGKGGNGGDGFVVARELRRRRLRPRVLLLASAEAIGGDAGGKLAQLVKSGVHPEVVRDDARTAPTLAAAGIIVDAIVGTGGRGAAAGLTARMIDRMNDSGRPIVALDVPSGLPPDGGAPAGSCIRATITVTFAGLKRGLLFEPGASLAGAVHVVPIGIPEAEVRRDVTTFVLEAADVAKHFPPRPREAHKGTYGHLLVVGGAAGKTGAAALAGNAAMRSGVGLVTVAVPASQQAVVAVHTLEAMTAALPETSSRSVAAKAREGIIALAGARDAVAIGPGLGLDEDTPDLARALARDLDRPLVLDADALTALAGHLDLLPAAAGARCLTPHPGEMARMLGVSVADVQRDRVGCVREFATRYRVHVVLKGALSVIGAPDGRVYVNPTGNAGMASGGMGDVLTGIAGAFLARGMDAGAALRSAVYLHGLAGDLAAARVGEEALIAGDVIAALPEAFARLAATGS